MKFFFLFCLLTTKLFGQAPKPLCPNPPCQVQGLKVDITQLLQTIISSSNEGDEIDLPPGRFEISSQVTTVHNIILKGAGIGQTILEWNPNLSDAQINGKTMLFFSINSNIKGNSQVTGITFRGNTASTSLSADVAIEMYKSVGFQITECHFEYFGEAAIKIIHDDSLALGLISGNEFYHNVKTADPTGLGLGYGVEIYGSNQRWITTTPGGPNYIFVENNTFDAHRHGVTNGGCGLSVVRYNSFRNNIISNAIDAHEAYPGDMYGNRFASRRLEAYNNSIVNNTFTNGAAIIDGQSTYQLSQNAIVIRGGEAVIYNNTISGFRIGVGIENYQLSGSQPYPITYGPGYLSGLEYGPNDSGSDGNHGNGDIFIWNNNFSLYNGTGLNVMIYNYEPQWWVYDRDYHTIAQPGYIPAFYPKQP